MSSPAQLKVDWFDPPNLTMHEGPSRGQPLQEASPLAPLRKYLPTPARRLLASVFGQHLDNTPQESTAVVACFADD